MDTLTITSPCFLDGEQIPAVHTGHGQDQSPELILHGLCREAVSIAVIMNDMGHPVPAYNHWVIWNIPVMPRIPGSISHGSYVEELPGAVQGIGYGKHKYRGPKPPFHWSHIYHFNVYVLDCKLELTPAARKKDLLSAMEGHILQQAVLTGHYR